MKASIKLSNEYIFFTHYSITELMELYIRQKALSMKDVFYIYDEQGKEKYYVEGDGAFDKNLHIYKMNGVEAAYISQKKWSFSHKFYIEVANKATVMLRQKAKFFSTYFFVEGLNWHIEGNMMSRGFIILSDDEIIGAISKEKHLFKDAYKINIIDEDNELYVLAITLIIDIIIALNSAAAA
ncbi:MAG: LURP-one-related family protein [Erysipelotrichaceae bacterium]|nr:LURP-one-related family protein [Erysipelotrichaceae bacterium]